jgi:hypothetical protein
VKDEAAAASLYGPLWRSNVDDLPQEFFGDYSIGAEVAPERIITFFSRLGALKLK